MRQRARTLFVGGLAVAVGTLVLVQEAAAQSGGRAQVLVAPFATSENVDFGFGRKIGDRLRDRVKDFQLLTAIEWGQVEDALNEFDLDAKQMDLISWRQLGGRLNSQLIIHGEVKRAPDGNGVVVDARFVSDRGETTEVSEITLDGTGGREARDAADHVAQELNRHVEFLRAVLNCQDYLSGNQLEDAARNCNRALEVRPNSPRANYLRGQVAQEQENWEEARRFYAEAYAQDRSDENVIQALAYTNAQLGELERSTELYREYLDFNPDDVDVRLSVAYNLANAGGYAEAMILLREGVERDSTNAALWRYLGDVAIRQGTESGTARLGGSSTGGGATIGDTAAIHQAIGAYEQYVALRPDSVTPALYRNMIGAHMQLGEREEAAAVAERALERFPEEPRLWSMRADMLAQSGSVEEAVGAMDRVLSLDPSYDNAYFKRGVFHLRSGDTEAAISDFRTAIEEQGADPNQVAQALFARGHSQYFKNDRFQPAIETFRTALEFAEEPSLRNQLHFWTGYSHFKLGEAVDKRNEAAEECGPARQALAEFDEVLPHLNQAGEYQQQSQGQIRQAVDVYLYRQEQIIRKSCGG